ncbi:unnamed protein product [Protopolystoma xenopodis]|uniref:Uncharacterized protein n=1 Tax=Protopolystoma xenopodis TaxID=117903 RepID=A0A448WC17_9PLAT|nr:unnamed protein product [Protopolystoma xenopodis]
MAWSYVISNTELMTHKEALLKTEAGQKLSPDEKNKIYLGIRQLNMQEMFAYSPTSPPPQPYPYRDQINSSALFRLFLMQCLSRSMNATEWSTTGCTASRVILAQKHIILASLFMVHNC